WTLLSILWAPLAGGAYAAGQIAVLYVGMLVACSMLLDGGGLRWVEPAVASGALIVIGYGLSERLLPGVLHFARSVSAEGRLEQPLTYWNAMGELAALGFVMTARLAGDATRPAWLRCAAAAAAAPLGLGLYISFSRGALFACAAGLLTLIVAVPWRGQLSAVLRAVAAGALAALSGAFFKGITSLGGTLSMRERQGAITLVALVVVMGLAGGVQYVLGRRERDIALRLPRGAPWIATGLVAAGLALAIVIGAHETSGTSQPLSGGATRLVTLQSNRYDYWHVALKAFAGEPVRGVGAGGWSVDWLRYRHIGEGAQDAHSLELQTLAELGLVGLALLAMFLAGVLWSGLRAVAGNAVAAAGPLAGLVAYLAHSPLDWDWQMPAVTLPAIALMGALVALAGRPAARAPRRSAAPHAGTPTPRPRRPAT
ncbi:MAG: O-antigen ligase family protein, partial [Solirubrobacteraceae bacterium]